MIGFALLGLLGVGLIVGISNSGDDDDEDPIAQDDGAERVQGTQDNDLLETGAGSDTVFAAAGDDFVDAGAGDDRVFGGEGDDFIIGGEGDDFLRGQAGDDILFGGAGADELNGDVGDDVLFGADIIDAEGIFDVTLATVSNGGNIDDIDQDQFLDLMADPQEADTLNGGVGDDIIIAGSNDVVDTGSGEDVLNVGEWVDPDAPVLVTGFDPSNDVIVYSYTGATTPLVSFGEDNSGTATLDVDGEIIAFFPGIDFFDLTANSSIVLERLS